MELYWRAGEGFSNSALEFRGGPGEMEEGENLVRTIPTSNLDPDQEQQGGLGVVCCVRRQRAEMRGNGRGASRALESEEKKRHTVPLKP